jgi:aminodeoxyfutalosine synthase
LHFPKGIIEKVNAGERLTPEDGIQLFQSADILTLGKLAQTVRSRLHGKRVYYSVNLHLNHTNICSSRCDFCAFSRNGDEPDAYAFSIEEVEQKIADAVREWNINEVHMVGGHNPDIGLEYFAKLFRRVRKEFPQVFIKALSAPEVDDLARRAGVPVREALLTLKEAGLGSLPGGGAEIFESRVRQKLCPQKIPGSRWLEIHREAHSLGIPSNATMLYGHVETNQDRVDHLLELRKLQDETKGFQSFVPLSFQRPDPAPGVGEVTGFTDLKVLSISRLMLDNIPHIKVHWSATDLKFAQAALSFGADDVGGTNLHERVMRAAGSRAPKELSSADLVRLIRDAGYEPCLVNSSY